MAKVFGSMIYKITEESHEIESPFESFTAVREAEPSKMVSWDRLEKLANRAFAQLQGPRSRSKHTSYLKREAWSQLGDISECVRNPAYLNQAHMVASDAKNPATERQAAVDFLPDYWNGDDSDEATATLLQNMEEEKKIPRDLLVSVLQVQIDLGLNDEFGALCAVDDWEDEKS